MPGIVVREFDICRDDKHDLTQANVWEEIYALLSKPNTVFITSPPCNTHSRARHKKPGPQPLRSSVWPRGFPWLAPPKAAAVEAANYMIDCSIKASIIAAERGNQFLWEHPEHLGIASDGLMPASIWEMPELLDVLARFHAITFALFQCQFGAPTSKPTRFLTSLSALVKSPPQFAELPRFDAQGRYLGPLPKTCPHGSHEGLIGKDPATGQWRTAPSASYPPQLCQFLAQAVADSLLRKGHNKSSSSAATQHNKSSSSAATQSSERSTAIPRQQDQATPRQHDLEHRGSQPECLSHQNKPKTDGLQPPCFPSQQECLLPQGLQPPCLPSQPECLLPQDRRTKPECLPSPDSSPKVTPRLDPVGFSSLGFRPEPVQEKGASSSASSKVSIGSKDLTSQASKPSETQDDRLSPGGAFKGFSAHAGFSPETTAEPVRSPEKVNPDGPGFPPQPPRLGSRHTPLARTAEAEPTRPTKVLAFPLPGESAEDYSGRLLDKQGPLERSELEALHDLLPLKSAPRGEEGADATAFVLGAYCKGGLVGLRKNTSVMPQVGRVLTRYVGQLQPRFIFSAIALFQGVRTPLHKDNRNAPFPNLVAPVGKFTGGAIWVENPEGQRPRQQALGGELI